MVQWVSTAMHELVHSLVFDSNLFRFFRNADGSPKMYRDHSDPDIIEGQVEWFCLQAHGSVRSVFPAIGGGLFWADISRVGIVTVATERGFNATTCQCPLGK